MRDRLYDVLMRLPIVALTVYFLTREGAGVVNLIGAHPYFGGDWVFFMQVAARIAICMFMAILVTLYLARLRPVRKYEAWMPKITALAGLLFIYVLLALPRAPAHSGWDAWSAALIILGNGLCIIAVLDLGRSLSVMPEARRLVTTGLYRRIRHPLYLAEEVAMVGVFLQFRSWQAAAILVLHFFFQLRRMHWEENILESVFPDYAAYRQMTWRLVPGVY